MNTDLSPEYGLLALSMADTDALNAAIAAGVKPDWFANPANQVIFRTITALHDRRVFPNDETVAVEITRTPEHKAGDVSSSDVHRAASFIGYGGNAEFLIEQLADHRRRRLLREMAHKALSAANDPTEPSEHAAAAADEALLAITTSTSHAPTDFPSAVAAALDPAQFGQGIATSLHDLDRATTGIHPAEYILVAARPSMGKTALMTTMAFSLAQSGIPVGIFSLEMSAGAVAQRIIASQAGIPVRDIRAGELSEDKLTRLAHAGAGISGLPIHIDDRAECTTSQIRATLRRWMRTANPPRVVFIDYLQMVQPDTSSRSDNREREVARISTAIKAMAKTHGVAVVALSQLSRKNETRPDKRPVISDLRDSGQIEQDADVVLLLHRPEYYNLKPISGKDAAGIAEVIVAKARNGVTGTVELYYDKPLMTFRSLYREPVAAPISSDLSEADAHSPF